MTCTKGSADSHIEIFADVALTVLQTMVFAVGERSAHKPLFEDNIYLLAQIGYCGDRSGQLAIMATKPLCREWAALMTDDDSESQVVDALREVANTIGGNWLTQAFSGGEVIKLQPPIAAIADPSYWDRMVNGPESVVLSVDGSPLVLHITALD